MKKLINRPERVVDEMCEGLLALYPGLSRLGGYNVLVRSDIHQVHDRQIALISGGGSGHEPAHAGFVGAGMLSGAVAGEIFTSPSAASVLAAIRAVAGRAGVLLIVKNYTGDRLNFGVAAEMARAEGIWIDTVVVSDDVALAGIEANAGRRGLAGTVLVHKIAGAAAAELKDLPQVVAIAQAAADSIGTMGVSLSAGTNPAVGKPSFELSDEVELGLGIHGEPGVRRIALRPADELVDELLKKLTATMRLAQGERLAVLINNLGATTGMEIAIAARRTLHWLEAHGLMVERLYGGTFVSSLDMAGVSISLLRVDDERLRWLDAPTTAPAWPNVLARQPGPISERTWMVDETKPISEGEAPPQSTAGKTTGRAIASACAALREAEDRLTEMDRLVGDGDLGTNLARGARAVEAALHDLPLDQPAATLKALGSILQEVLGGSSGPLYGVLLLRAGSSLEGSASADLATWALAVKEACQAVSELGGAREGDRTMLDALIPFARVFAAQAEARSGLEQAVSEAVLAAEKGAEATRSMIARRGRSSYLGERAKGQPDPGAMAAVVWLKAIGTQIVAD